MTAGTGVRRVNIEHSGVGLRQPAEHLRGMTVVDPHLHRVGEVDGLIVDEEERLGRLLVVASGGIVGLARIQRLVLVEAVTRVDHQVHLGASHEQVHRGAELTSEALLAPVLDEVYRHYGYSPFWAPSQLPPRFLRLP